MKLFLGGMELLLHARADKCRALTLHFSKAYALCKKGTV